MVHLIESSFIVKYEAADNPSLINEFVEHIKFIVKKKYSRNLIDSEIKNFNLFSLYDTLIISALSFEKMDNNKNDISPIRKLLKPLKNLIYEKGKNIF